MVGSPAGDFDYDRHGHGYAGHRRADPRIATYVHRALGDPRTVLNVGAGAGSYEPDDRRVLAVEPSPVMRAQRPPHLLQAVDATAERLPFDNQAFDAAMAMVTVHQWPDPAAGLAELRRVASGPVVVLTFDPDALSRLWLAEYAPARPEQFLDPAVRRAQSAWGFVSPAAQERAVTTLRADLDCGKWDEMYHDLRTQPQFDGALRMVVGQPVA